MSTGSSVILKMDTVTSNTSRCSSFTAAVTLWIVMAFVRIIYGVVNFKECPQRLGMFLYLLALALLALFFMCTMTKESESDAARPQQKPNISASVFCIVGLCLCSMVNAGSLCGVVIHQLKYANLSDSAISCNQKLYTFAFFNSMWEICLFVLYACNIF